MFAPFKAQPLLLSFQGQSVPERWQGGLELTYRTGPGFQDPSLRLRMEVHNKLETRTIYNVIGTITGSEEPDRYVLMGNHRDAWVYGAADAISGSSILMELSRGLSKLLKSGWRPRRTIMLCSWDAEEVFVVGSTEWVEENANILWDRAVAYLNMDVAVSGDFALNVDSSPVLFDVLLRTAKEIRDPTAVDSDKSMFDVMIERDVTKNVNKTANCNNLSFGSDYASFYHFTGVSSADWSYIFGGKHGLRRSYPVYHSTHDTLHWLKTFVDPQFKIHLAVAKFAASVLLKLSDSALLPFNTTKYATIIKRYYHSMKNDTRFDRTRISFDSLSKAVDKFDKACKEFEAFKNGYSEQSGLQSLRVLNDQMTKLERAFIQTVEENNPLQFRHVIYAPNLKNLYQGIFFPRVYRALPRAIQTHNWDEVKKEISLLVYHINSASKQLFPLS